MELAGRIEPARRRLARGARHAPALGRRHGRRQRGGDHLRGVPGASRARRPGAAPRPPGGGRLRERPERRRRPRGASPRPPGRVDPRRTTGRSWRPGDDWEARWPARSRGRSPRCARRSGPDPASWTWGRLHVARPRHPLSAAFPEAATLLDPPASPAGGDGDTVQAADFVPAAGFDLTLTSVARYVFDLGDWERSAWIVPLGRLGPSGKPALRRPVGGLGGGAPPPDALRLGPRRRRGARATSGSSPTSG